MTMEQFHTDKTMILTFYDYDACFSHYAGFIRHLRQNILYGKTNIAKPTLLLAVIGLIDSNWIRGNSIVLTVEIENRYSDLYHQYDPSKETTPVCYPFFHLHSDGFWHISWIGDEREYINSPSRKFLVDHIDHVSLDDDLWVLLQNPDYRHRMMHFIIREKLSAN